MKKIPKICLTVFLCLVVILVSYDGDLAENSRRNAIILHTFPDVREPTHEKNFFPIEWDSYGRQLLALCGDSLGKYTYALLIGQQSQPKEVFYYDDINYIAKYYDEEPAVLENKYFSVDLVKHVFSQEEVAQLKAQNDWGLPLQKEKFFRMAVSRKRAYLSGKDGLKALALAGGSQQRVLTQLLTVDKYGKKIFYVEGNNKSGSSALRLLVMYDCWGNLIEGEGIREIKDVRNVKEDIIALKKANDWCSFPYAEK